MITSSELASLFAEFTSSHGITVSPGAQGLVLQLLNCVELDPHETWSFKSELLRRHYDNLRLRLPAVLEQMVEEHKLEKKITTIDVVHWTGRHMRNQELWGCWPNEDELPDIASRQFPFTISE